MYHLSAVAAIQLCLPDAVQVSLPDLHGRTPPPGTTPSAASKIAAANAALPSPVTDAAGSGQPAVLPAMLRQYSAPEADSAEGKGLQTVPAGAEALDQRLQDFVESTTTIAAASLEAVDLSGAGSAIDHREPEAPSLPLPQPAGTLPAADDPSALSGIPQQRLADAEMSAEAASGDSKLRESSNGGALDVQELGSEQGYSGSAFTPDQVEEEEPIAKANSEGHRRPFFSVSSGSQTPTSSSDDRTPGASPTSAAAASSDGGTLAPQQSDRDPQPTSTSRTKVKSPGSFSTASGAPSPIAADEQALSPASAAADRARSPNAMAEQVLSPASAAAGRAPGDGANIPVDSSAAPAQPGSYAAALAKGLAVQPGARQSAAAQPATQQVVLGHHSASDRLGSPSRAADATGDEPHGRSTTMHMASTGEDSTDGALVHRCRTADGLVTEGSPQTTEPLPSVEINRICSVVELYTLTF